MVLTLKTYFNSIVKVKGNLIDDEALQFVVVEGRQDVAKVVGERYGVGRWRLGVPFCCNKIIVLYYYYYCYTSFIK